jgi:hypothetical protein
MRRRGRRKGGRGRRKGGRGRRREVETSGMPGTWGVSVARIDTISCREEQ